MHRGGRQNPREGISLFQFLWDAAQVGKRAGRPTASKAGANAASPENRGRHQGEGAEARQGQQIIKIVETYLCLNELGKQSLDIDNYKDTVELLNALTSGVSSVCSTFVFRSSGNRNCKYSELQTKRTSIQEQE